MNLTGQMLIGGQSVSGTREALHAINPATGQPLQPGYAGGDQAHVEQAGALAWAAFDAYRETTPAQRAQ